MTTAHGGLLESEARALGLDPQRILDFSANLNPNGAPRDLLERLRNVNLTMYPDPSCSSARAALSRRLSVGPENLLLGNGSSELIHLAARAVAGPDAEALILSPTFGEYAAAASAVGVRAVTFTAGRSSQFVWDMEALLPRLRDRSPRLVFLCNPNNPTGGHVSEEFVRQVVEALPSDGILILDEAYRCFVESPWDPTPLVRSTRVVVVRSLTKELCIPGVRIGYALGDGSLIERMACCQPSWAVNSLAQAAVEWFAEAAIDGDPVSATVRHTRTYLEGELRSLGLETVPSAANFVLVRVGRAAQFRRRLLRKGFCVRDCSSFRLPAYVRIAIGPMPDCEKLVSALKEVLKQ